MMVNLVIHRKVLTLTITTIYIYKLVIIKQSKPPPEQKMHF